ncbi:hypothetical protein Sulku_2103 [Sulfuricurvum kujiense DSM 16994]|uniref:Transposase IS200-like domain-containing protein n=1 Tax=Sulfuricurvum kujiense (strain ATCC BAA-921 / DSM 16994 / JCM 11577 / YK-1) TaxID=709032 RepID=E4U2Z9_SULKY|nr:transposase [Sulfuricurvum kujiense]ADR34763.1 hypothetical protein Sulku_2103 [Sulfuricurvum kujiense DSM 16994]
MPRPPRYNEIGTYHVINRGVERREVFLDQRDYDQFMAYLGDLVTKYGIQFHAYCLMNNHYHLLLETVSDNLSDALKYLNVNYSKYFNQTYQRTGHLWQGRFKSFPIHDETQFWTVAKYIERNPIAAGIVKNINEYPYHSYQIVSQSSHTFSYIIDQSKIHTMQDSEYSEFIDTPLQNEILKSIYKMHRINKDTTDKKYLHKPISTFFDQKGERNEKIRACYRYGYTQADIADFLGLSRTAINKIIR